MNIKPTVGRVVHFYAPIADIIHASGPGPFAAVIAYVHSDSMVNLAVFDSNGNACSRTSVTLVQEGDARPAGMFCEWMPYQKGQAAKTEAVEARLSQVTEASIEKEIQDKGLTAPRITPAHVEQLIVDEQYYVFPWTSLTVCCLTLANGFPVTGESCCASPENFDAELGRKIARENAKEKVWMLEGYLLKQRLSEVQ